MTFTEPTSGIIMRKGLFYILKDDGSAFDSAGYYNEIGALSALDNYGITDETYHIVNADTLFKEQV
jgi:hypothetical protein